MQVTFQGVPILSCENGGRRSSSTAAFGISMRVLAELESKVGAKGRRKFEKFLRQVAEDEDEDAIDVESK